MLIQVADIPPEGLRVEGTADFPRPFQDPAWALDDLALTLEKDGDTVFVRRIGNAAWISLRTCLALHPQRSASVSGVNGLPPRSLIRCSPRSDGR